MYSITTDKISELTNQTDVDSLKQLYKDYLIVKKASTELNIDEFSKFVEYFSDLVESSEKKFRRDLDVILRIVNRQDGMDLESLATLQPNMRFLRNFKEVWESLNQSLIMEYLKIWSVINDQLNQSAQNVANEISRGYNIEYELKGVSINDDLKTVEGLEWIDELEGQDNVKQAISGIK